MLVLVLLNLIQFTESISGSVVPLAMFNINSVFGNDDEDNIGRDVEEEERKRVVINNAAGENEDDTNQTKLLLCGIFFAHQSSC